MNPLQPNDASWGFLEWVITGAVSIGVAFAAWVARIHYTVGQHTKDIAECKVDRKELATKDDIDDLKKAVNRLLDYLMPPYGGHKGP